MGGKTKECLYCGKELDNKIKWCNDDHKKLYWEDSIRKPLEKRICICGATFVPHRPDQLYHSRKCAYLQSLETYKLPYQTELPRGTTGAISELMVSAQLARLGYDIFRAISPACFCDLVAIKKGKIFKIEVRTGQIKQTTGEVSFNKELREGVNLFAVYVPKHDIIYYFDINLQPVILK